MNWLRDLHGDHIVRVTNAQVYRLMACFVLCCLTQMGNVPVWILALAAALIAWRTHIERQGVPLPSNIVKSLLGCLLFLGVWLDKGTFAGRDAGTALMAGLVAIKFLELRGRRDYMVLTFALYFMSMTALLFDQTILVFGYVVISCGFLTVNLVGLYLIQPEDVFQRKPARFTFRLLLCGFPLALVLFLFFPRIDAKFGFDLDLNVIGLPSSVKAGSFDLLAEDSGMAFRADFPQGIPPSQDSLYWRAFFLTDYNVENNEWTAAATGLESLGKADLGENLRGGRAVEQRITLYPHSKSWLFALDYPAAPAWNGQAALYAGNVLQVNRELHRKIQYFVVSKVDSHPVTISPMMRHATLAMGPVPPAVRKLGESFRPEGATDRQAVDNALNYFIKNHFEYTTEPQNYGDDPLYEFLFTKRRGFCEHYASAFTVLMRLAGVPARVVIGYLGGEFNPYGNFVIVRHLNAHAWSEVYLEGQGWTRVDPTATAGLDGSSSVSQNASASGGGNAGGGQILGRFGGALTPIWMKQLMLETRYRWQLAEEMWDYWVLSYSPEFQLDMLRNLRLEKFVWELFFAMTGIALGITLYVTSRSSIRKKTGDEKLQAVYGEFCRCLEREGVLRHPWEGPHEYASRAAKILDYAAEPIRNFCGDYALVRYGRNADPERELEPLREKMRLVKKMLDRSDLN